jgi:FAD/FMN-containing dehydrogenase
MPPSLHGRFLGLNNAPSCTVGGYPTYVVNVTSVAQIQLAVNFARERNLRLVIKNTGHDFGAKSVGGGSLSIWTHHLKDMRYFTQYSTKEYTGPAVKLGAGVQVFEANQFAKEHDITVVGGEGKVSNIRFCMV